MRPIHTLTLAAMVAGAAAFAQTGSSDTSSRASTSSAAAMGPTAVLSLLQQVDRDEIRLANIAQSKATSDKVKDYARDMIKDHGDLDKELNEFATQNKLMLGASHLPSAKRTELISMVQDAERRLTSATGAQFDREYMQTMSQSHAKALSDLDAVMPAFKDKKDQNKVYDLVKSARDKVEDHKKHADDVLKDLARETATGGSGTSGSSTSHPNPGGTGR